MTEEKVRLLARVIRELRPDDTGFIEFGRELLNEFGADEICARLILEAVPKLRF